MAAFVKRWEGVLKFLVTLSALAGTSWIFSTYFVMTRAAHGQTAAAQRLAHEHLASSNHGHPTLQEALKTTGEAVGALSSRVDALELTQRSSHAEVARYLHGMSCVVVDRGTIRPDGGCSRGPSLVPIRPLPDLSRR